MRINPIVHHLIFDILDTLPDDNRSLLNFSLIDIRAQYHCIRERTKCEDKGENNKLTSRARRDDYCDLCEFLAR